MAFLSGEILEKVLKSSITSGFDSKRIKQLSYELSLGSEVFLSDSDGKPEKLDEKNVYVVINPGQFALLLTEENIAIPNEYLGLISIKAKEKLKGLINVSGFHVDPGFKGKLLFSVYNAGSATITLKKGNPYFLIWLAEISEPLSEKEEYNSSSNSHQDQNSIPLKYVDALKSGELASPSSLLEEIKGLKSSITIFKWFLGIILTLSIATCARFYWLKSNYEDGFNDGYSKSQIEEKVDQKVELILNNKVDSVINVRLNSIDLDTIE